MEIHGTKETMMKYCIIGRRSSGETLVFTKMEVFSLRTTSTKLFHSKTFAENKMRSIKSKWKGLALSIENVGDGSNLFPLISDNAQIGQNGY
jgi:hypothetical protein